MKRNIVGIFLFCLMFGSLFYVFYTKKSSWTNYALNSPTEDTEDTVLHNIDSENGKFQEFEKTGFTWRDSKGDEFPVYMAHTGSCFIIRTSKSGDEYRAYLGEEVSKQIRKELSKSDTRRDRHCFKNRTLKQ